MVLAVLVVVLGLVVFVVVVVEEEKEKEKEEKFDLLATMRYFLAMVWTLIGVWSLNDGQVRDQD